MNTKQRLDALEKAMQQSCCDALDMELTTLTIEEKRALSKTFDGCTDENAMLAWLDDLMNRHGLGGAYRALGNRPMI